MTPDDPNLSATAPDSIGAITHSVTDMARTAAFYEALGFRSLYGERDAAFTSYAVGDGYLNLIKESRADRCWWGRVIFYVPDVDAFHTQAVAAGLSPEFAPRDAP